jgi:hypothetical protein
MSATEWLPPQSKLSTPPPSVPPGWYADPHGRGQRYWDGVSWSEQLAPLAPPSFSVDKHPATTGDWVAGVLLALLVPVVGFVLGIVWAAKGGKRGTVGIACLILSVVAAGFWFGLTHHSGSASTATYPTV